MAAERRGRRDRTPVRLSALFANAYATGHAGLRLRSPGSLAPAGHPFLSSVSRPKAELFHVKQPAMFLARYFVTSRTRLCRSLGVMPGIRLAAPRLVGRRV